MMDNCWWTITDDRQLLMIDYFWRWKILVNDAKGSFCCHFLCWWTITDDGLLLMMIIADDGQLLMTNNCWWWTIAEQLLMMNNCWWWTIADHGLLLMMDNCWSWTIADDGYLLMMDYYWWWIIADHGHFVLVNDPISVVFYAFSFYIKQYSSTQSVAEVLPNLHVQVSTISFIIIIVGSILVLSW